MLFFQPNTAETNFTNHTNLHACLVHLNAWVSGWIDDGYLEGFVKGDDDDLDGATSDLIATG